MSSVIIARDTHVSLENWAELKQLGLSHVTNHEVSDLDPSTYRDSEKELEKMRWDAGDDRIFTGDAFDYDADAPFSSDELENQLYRRGVYALVPEDWQWYWSRLIQVDDPRVQEAGIARLLYDSDAPYEDQFRWELWEHQPCVFRCWGPGTGQTKFEGSWEQVIAHMKAWDTTLQNL